MDMNMQCTLVQGVINIPSPAGKARSPIKPRKRVHRLSATRPRSTRAVPRVTFSTHNMLSSFGSQGDRSERPFGVIYTVRHGAAVFSLAQTLSLIHISEPTRLGMI